MALIGKHNIDKCNNTNIPNSLDSLRFGDVICISSWKVKMNYVYLDKETVKTLARNSYGRQLECDAFVAYWSDTPKFKLLIFEATQFIDKYPFHKDNDSIEIISLLPVYIREYKSIKTSDDLKTIFDKYKIPYK